MSETKKPTPTSDADRSPERIGDPKAGLRRMEKALKRILIMPKSALDKARESERTGREDVKERKQ